VTTSNASKTVIARQTNTADLNSSTPTRKGDTIIGQYHNVVYPAKQYRHHDWHDEEMLTANKQSRRLTVGTKHRKTYKKMILSNVNDALTNGAVIRCDQDKFYKTKTAQKWSLEATRDQDEDRRTARLAIPGEFYLYWPPRQVSVVVGNSLVVAAIARDRRRLGGVQNYFIASLAVSDLLVGLFIMPPTSDI